MPMWADWDIIDVDTLFAGGMFEVLHKDFDVAPLYQFCFAGDPACDFFPA